MSACAAREQAQTDPPPSASRDKGEPAADVSSQLLAATSPNAQTCSESLTLAAAAPSIANREAERRMSTSLRGQFTYLGLLTGCLWLGSPISATRAQATAAASQRETARSLMDEGERMRAAGDLRAALLRFKAAHALVHTPTTGLQLARAHSGLGEYVEARGAALEASHHQSSAGEPAVFAQARSEAGNLAAELEPRIPSLQVQVSPAQADFFWRVDGTVLPDSFRALPYKTNPGQHEVVIEAPGYNPERRLISLVDAQAQVVQIALTPLPAAPVEPQVSPQMAALTIAPVSANEPLRDAVVEAQRTRAYVGLAAGGLVALTGMVTGVVSAVKTSNLNDRCERGACPPSTRDAMSSANLFANIANVTLPLGLVGIGYGLYELLTLPKANAAPRSAAALQLDWDGTTASVRGSL